MDRSPTAQQPDFRAVYDEHAGVVRRALRQLGVDAASLDDATQDVFVVLFRRIEDFDPHRSLRSWLWGIARGVASGYRRAARRSRRLRANLPPPRVCTEADEHLARRRALRILSEFLAGLDEDKCAVFVMAEIEGHTGPEIAARLQVNLNTVYARLRAARQRFDRTVARRGGNGRPMVAALAPLWRWPTAVLKPAASAAVAAPLVLTVADLPDAALDDATVVASMASARRPASRKPVVVDKDAPESTDVDEGVEPMTTTIVLTALLVTAPTPLQPTRSDVTDQDADAAACADKDGITECTFENDHLEGDVLGPSGELIPFRRPTKHGSLLDIRPHFIPEMIRLGYDL